MTSDPKVVENNVYERTYTKELEIPLKHTDLAEMAKTAGLVQSEIDEIEADFAEVRKAHQAELSDMRTRLGKILQAAHAGKENRLVETTERRDYNSCMIQHYYDGEVVAERAMTSDEMNDDSFRQQELPLQTHSGDEEEQVETGKSVDEQIAEDIRESTNPRTASTATH